MADNPYDRIGQQEEQDPYSQLSDQAVGQQPQTVPNKKLVTQLRQRYTGGAGATPESTWSPSAAGAASEPTRTIGKAQDVLYAPAQVIKSVVLGTAKTAGEYGALMAQTGQKVFKKAEDLQKEHPYLSAALNAMGTAAFGRKEGLPEIEATSRDIIKANEAGMQNIDYGLQRSYGASPESYIKSGSEYLGDIGAMALKAEMAGPLALPAFSGESAVGKAYQATEQDPEHFFRGLAAGGASGAATGAMIQLAGAKALGADKAYKGLLKLAAAKAARGTALGTLGGTADAAIDKVILNKDVSVDDWLHNVRDSTAKMIGLEVAGAIPEARLVMGGKKLAREYATPQDAQADLMPKLAENIEKLGDLKVKGKTDTEEWKAAKREHDALQMRVQSATYAEKSGLPFAGSKTADNTAKQELQSIKETGDDLSQRIPEEEVPSTGEGGENLQVGGAGMGRGLEGEGLAREGETQEKAPAVQAPEVTPEPPISWHDLPESKRNEVKQSISESVEGLTKDPGSTVELYKRLPDTRDGRIASGDFSRLLHPDYSDNPNWGGGAFGESPSHVLTGEMRINKIIRDAAIDRAASEGKEGAILVGGQGSGKTTLAKKILDEDPNIGVVVDGLHMDPDEIHTRVEDMKRKGVYPHLILVDRDPVEAFRSTIDRSNKEIRHVSPEFFLKAHARAPQAVIDYLDRNPSGVGVHRAENSENGFRLTGGDASSDAGKESLSEIKNVSRMGSSELANRIRQAYTELKEQEHVRPDVARSIEATTQGFGTGGNGENIVGVPGAVPSAERADSGVMRPDGSSAQIGRGLAPEALREAPVKIQFNDSTGKRVEHELTDPAKIQRYQEAQKKLADEEARIEGLKVEAEEAAKAVEPEAGPAAIDKILEGGKQERARLHAAAKQEFARVKRELAGVETPVGEMAPPPPEKTEAAPVVDAAELDKANLDGKPVELLPETADPLHDYVAQSRLRPTVEPYAGVKHGEERGIHFTFARQIQNMRLADEVATNRAWQKISQSIPVQYRYEARDYLDAKAAGLPADEATLSQGAKDYLKIHNYLANGELARQFEEAVTNKSFEQMPMQKYGSLSPFYVPRLLTEESLAQVKSEALKQRFTQGALKTTAAAEHERTIMAGTDLGGDRYTMVLSPGKNSATVFKDGDAIGEAKLIQKAVKPKTKLKPELDETGEQIIGMAKSETAPSPAIYKFGDKELTLGQATAKEIHKDTGLEYLYDPLVSTMATINDFANVNRMFGALEDLNAKGVVLPTAEAPKDWEPLTLVNFKGKSAPQNVASVLNALDRNRKAIARNTGTVIDQIRATSRLLVNIGFIQPMVHGPNELDHGFIGGGVTRFVTRNGYKDLHDAFQASAVAAGHGDAARMLHSVDAVTNPLGSDLLIKTLNAGGRVMNFTPQRNAMLRTYTEALGKSLKDHPAYWDDLAAQIGVKRSALTDAVNAVGDKVWMVDNVMRISQYLKAARDMKLDVNKPNEYKRAIQYVDTHGYADFDIPPAGKVGRLFSKVQDVPEFLFTKYHFGAVRLFKNKIHDAIQMYQAVKPSTWKDPARRKELLRGADRLAALGVMAYLIYPALDKLMQKVSGDEEFKFRRGGTTHLMKLAKEVGTLQKTPGQASQSLLTQAPHLRFGIAAVTSRDPYTGQPIYHPGALRHAKESLQAEDYGGAAKDLAMFGYDPMKMAISTIGPAQTWMSATRERPGEEPLTADQKLRNFLAYQLGGTKEAEGKEEKNLKSMRRDYKSLKKRYER